MEEAENEENSPCIKTQKGRANLEPKSEKDTIKEGASDMINNNKN